jgi:hypothetical protein
MLSREVSLYEWFSVIKRKAGNFPFSQREDSGRGFLSLPARSSYAPPRPAFASE